jgi:uncharacterized membrane protein
MSNGRKSALPENIAALLSYVLGWITGLIFILIDRRPYVRFHAAQSIVVFLGLHILRVLLGVTFGVGWWFGGYGGLGFSTLAAALLNLLGLVTLVLWIVLMVKAFQGVRFKLPLAGEIAENSPNGRLDLHIDFDLGLEHGAQFVKRVCSFHGPYLH